MIIRAALTGFRTGPSVLVDSTAKAATILTLVKDPSQKMSRSSVVTYEHVRQACYEILAKGERPTRPAVQELLSTDRYVGQKGSNAVVQNHIQEFWSAMANTLQVPVRTVDGIPEAFVTIIDRALGDMVQVAKRLAEEGLREREAHLDKRSREMEATVQEANERALESDQLRLRMESEVAALKMRIGDLEANLAECQRKLTEESHRVLEHQRTIDEKDAELVRQFSSLDAARLAIEQTNEHHRLETHRLLQQLDNERQAASKERRQQNEEVERARKDAATAREESIALREDCARLKGESAKACERLTEATASMETLRSSLEKAEAQLSISERDLAAVRVRHEMADQLRQEATVRLNVQAEEIGQLRQEIANLRRRRVKSRASEESSLRSKEETDAKRANSD